MGLWPAIRNNVSVKNRLIKQVKMDLKNKSIDINKMVVGGMHLPTMCLATMYLYSGRHLTTKWISDGRIHHKSLEDSSPAVSDISMCTIQ